MHRRSAGLGFALLCLSILVLGCATADDPQPIQPSNRLRVGIAPDYPPLIFKRGEAVVGLEADLAAKLAEGLGRSLSFVELPWEGLIPALLGGDIDIIMSGMSITKGRKLRIAFSEPYLNNGLLALMRRTDAGKDYDSPEGIMKSYARIGVMKGTTGDIFVQRNCPNATRVGLSGLKDAVSELRLRGIDLFIHDGYAVAWLVSENEADLTALWKLLEQDHLAWGMRRDDTELVGSVNGLLSQWKRDGVLSDVLRRWLPYAEHFGGIPRADDPS